LEIFTEINYICSFSIYLPPVHAWT